MPFLIPWEGLGMGFSNWQPLMKHWGGRQVTLGSS
jgi:hypothetical protein